MNRIMLSAALVCALTIQCSGCAQPEAIDALHPLPAPSATAQPQATPAPSLATTYPSPTAETDGELSAADFMPLESVFISYDVNGGLCESNVEFFDKSSGLLQKRFTGVKSAPYIEVYSVTAGAVELLYTRDDVGYTYDFTGFAPNSREILLKYPITSGASWAVPGGKSSITSVDSQLLLPITTQKTVEVSTEYNDGTSKIRYYSQSLGLCAQYEYDSNDNLISAWKAIERDRDRVSKQRVRFYYADQSDWSVKYIPRDLNIKANTDIAARLSDELRKIPSGSFLVPLAARAKVLSITVDHKNGIAVDLSREFVTQMQVGRTGEKLRLQALADTFGEYFQSNAVYFTVGGELYESQYFMLINSDEYITVNTKNAQRFKD